MIYTLSELTQLYAMAYVVPIPEPFIRLKVENTMNEMGWDIQYFDTVESDDESIYEVLDHSYRAFMHTFNHPPLGDKYRNGSMYSIEFEVLKGEVKVMVNKLPVILI